ncbi:MAG: HD domain-containing phosphohydrolase [Nitrospirota bacterium]|nr:HD domain-containing phosphohydrolase [Nitrospirota bacterium]
MNAISPTPVIIHAIDDDVDDLELLHYHLQNIPQWPIAFHRHQNLEEAMACLDDQPHAVLIVDYFLGQKTALDVLHHLRDEGYDHPVIILAGSGNESIAVDVMKAGAADYLSKNSLTTLVLQQAIGHALETHQLRQTVRAHQKKNEVADQELIRRMRSEKELVEETLNGSLEAMTQVLSLMNPEVFNRSTRIKRYVTAIARQMGLPVIWQFEIAALLSQIGMVTFPHELLRKIARSKELSHQETQLFHQYPQIGADMIKKIPRMEKVADIIAYQNHVYQGGSHEQPQSVTLDAIPLGSRILKLAIDLDNLESSGHSKQRAFQELQRCAHQYDPVVLQAVREVSNTMLSYKPLDVSILDLKPNMMLADDIRAKSGAIVIPKGQPVTFTLLTRLHNFTLFQPVQEPIRVLSPVTTLQEELILEGTTP